MRELSKEQKFNLALEASFNRAIKRKENLNAEGLINWSFIDADMWMDMAREYPEFEKSTALQEIYSDEFNALIDQFLEIEAYGEVLRG